MLRPVLDAIAPELSGQACLGHVQTITRHHRIQASPGYRAAAEACLRTLEQAGLQARLTSYPATGRNRVWTHLVPQEWDCRDAELWLLDPNGQKSERLAWFAEAPISLIQRSAATPPEGLTCELAVIEGAAEPASWDGADVDGKLVLVGDGDIHRIWQWARRAGAIGLLTDRMTPAPPVRPEGDLADARQYTSFWWSEGEPKGWGFVITPRQGQRLRRLLREGPVRLWARVEARFYDGQIENVEAVIPGAIDEEVLVVSHLCHPKPSANDNATGPATVMEAARALKRLIDARHLAPPKRTIRFLFPPEFTGTYAHLSAMDPAERARIVAALNVDMVGQRQEVTGSVLLCEYPPLACPSFAGDLLQLVFGEVAAEVSGLSGLGRRYASFRHATVPFSGGSDHYILADPSVGIPCPMVIQWPDRFYHTSADTPEKTDPEMMRRVAAMVATYAYFLAGAGLPEARWLAAEMTALFPAQLHAAIAGATDPEAAAGFRVERKQADLQSLLRLVGEAERPDLERTLQVCARQLHLSAEMELQRAALAPSEEPAGPEGAGGAPGEVQGWTGAADLSAIYPVRTTPGPVQLRNYLPALGEEAESWHAFCRAHPGAERMADYLCFWADGARSLAEVCRLTWLETGLRDDAWALGYFQLLSRLGLAKGL